MTYKNDTKIKNKKITISENKTTTGGLEVFLLAVIFWWGPDYSNDQICNNSVQLVLFGWERK